MSVRQYIGARYVPLFADPLEWDSTNSYEPLTVVMNQGSSYVSKQSVPVGVQITNTTYWIKWADYNAQIEAYRQEVEAYNGRISAMEEGLPVEDFSAQNTVKDAIDGVGNLGALLPSTDFSAQNTVKDAIDGISVLLPDTDFSAQNTVKDAIDAISTLLPDTDFSAQNTVKDAIDAINAKFPITTNDIADGTITTNDIADGAVTMDKLAVNLFVTPEQYGAVGDGETDDTEAFQDMLEDIEDKTVIVFRQDASYVVNGRLDVTNNEVSIIALSETEYYPRIKFTNTGYGFNVTGYSFSMHNVHVESTGVDANITLVLLDRDNSSANGNIDAYFTNCGFAYANYGIKTLGRNVKIVNNIFSQIGDRAIVLGATSITTDMRGFVISGNRFHDCTACVVNLIANYANEGCSVQVSNNYMDGGNVLYFGTSDNVMISENYVSRIAVMATNIINFNNTVKADSICVVQNNTVACAQTLTTQYARTFLGIISDAKGKFVVNGNSMLTKATNAPILIIGEQTNPIVLLMTNNMFVNLATSSTMPNNTGGTVTGLIANNIFHGSLPTYSGCTMDNNISI